MGSPNKFVHIVYKTHQFQEMIAWYAEVFDSANAFMRSDAFASNNIGEPFDPQELVVLRAAGKPVAAKLVRTDQLPVDEPA